MPLDRDSCDVFSSQYKVCEVEVCVGKTVGSPLRASHARSGGLSHAPSSGSGGEVEGAPPPGHHTKLTQAVGHAHADQDGAIHPSPPTPGEMQLALTRADELYHREDN